MVCNVFVFFSDINIYKEVEGKYDMEFIVWVIVLNFTFNNISVVLEQTVLLVEETGVPGEHH